MTSWTTELGTAGSGSLNEYEKGIPIEFVERLNSVGFFSCLIPDTGGNPDPERDMVTRFVWDKGGSSEQVHFEGVVTDVRRHADLGDVFRIKGFSLEGLLWQLGTGEIRDYRNTDPHSIVTQTGSPNGLVFGAQGSRRSVGSTTVQYGSNSVPWKLTSTNDGEAMDFRADSERSWLNIQRLLLQGKHEQSEYPSWAETPPGDTDNYGLDAWVQLDGAGNTEPRLYLAGRKERSANHTPETFNAREDFAKPRRGEEGATAAEAIRVVGSGSGRARAESTLIGSGGIEGVLAEKTILGDTEATNQARRLSTLLDPTEEVFTGWLLHHDHDTRVGDRITVTEDGKSDSTRRVFTRGYRIKTQGFFLVAGRPKSLPEDPFQDVQKLAGGQAHGSQVMQGTATESSFPRSSTNTSLSDGGDISVSLSFDNATFDADYHEALVFFPQISTDTQGPYDVEITVDGTSTPVYRSRVETPGTDTWEEPVYAIDSLLRGVVGASGEVSSATMTVTNQTGGSVNVTVQLSGWLQS